MKNTKRSIMGFAAVAAGCASLMAATPVFATEQAEPIKAVLITKDAEMIDASETVMLTVTTSSYEELAKEGIVSEETVNKMNEFAQNHVVQVNIDSDQVINYTASSLDEMVKGGIITQAEKDKIDEYYASQVTEGTAAVMMEAAIAVETAAAE